MPYTVKACFEAFNKDIVNLDSEQTKTANSSRDWLIGQIHHKCAENILPASYFERDIKFGSFARKTKIRPLDDIDLMICYKGQGGTYHSTEITGVYDIRIPDNVKVLSELRNDDGMLNSRKVVENLKAALKNVPQYQKADIHRNQEAVTLTLSSYEWNFDIVPCFYTMPLTAFLSRVAEKTPISQSTVFAVLSESAKSGPLFSLLQPGLSNLLADSVPCFQRMSFVIVKR